MIPITDKIFNRLTEVLDGIDKPKIKNLIDKFGLYETGRILGYDISHYNNLLMSGRLVIEDLKNRGPKNLLQYVDIMKNRLNKDTYWYIVENYRKLQDAIDRNSFKDYDHDWFSGNTMINMYSSPIVFEGQGIETPQQVWMRVAIQLYHDESVEKVIETYEDMASGWYTPASPTIFNAGMKDANLSSCFLLSIGDNLESILKNGSYRAGLISKVGGGLGFNISNVRHSEIRDIGRSDGIIPMLQVYNDVVRYVNQLGRRKGAATVFLRPHHLDVEDFVDLSLKVGERHVRAHDINTCLWTSWIFWKRVIEDDKWTLFCPAKVPELNNLYGTEFTKAYIAAENNPLIANRHKKVISARGLYDRIRKTQLETGMPYLMDGDGSNLKSNQRHLGYIGGSNLCLEIVEYTDEDNIASCNLHSLSLRMFAKHPINKLIEPTLAITQCIDFKQLGKIVHNVIRNLNKIIDHTVYPLDKVKDGKLKAGIINKTNNKHRPIAMGVSGFAEMLHIVDLPFETETTKLLNEMVFACMYWNALASSIQLAIKDGPYESFKGSPTSFGKLQFDLWKEEFDILGPNSARKKEDDDPLDPTTWDQQDFILYGEDGKVIDTISPSWEDLKRCVVKYGLRNSLLIGLMPTASTAQIRRNCESVEAHQNNLYSRKVMKYSYPVLNRYLVDDFIKEGIWNNNAIEYMKVKNGSIQGITNYISNNRDLFPNYSNKEERIAFLELKYKTQWEISQKWMLGLAAKRGRYVDQSMSTNIYLRDCTQSKLMACHLYASKLGLKTLMYYLRQKGGETIKFTADPSMMKHIQNISVDTLKEKQDVTERQLLLSSGLIEDKETSPNISGEKRKYKCDDNSCCT